MMATRFLISGRVQGVFFRESAATQARRLGIAGHAVNLRDGRVEVLAWGSDAALDELARWLAHGPPMARVDDIRRSSLTDEPAPPGFSTGWG